MDYLAINIGNTRTKLALFQHDEIMEKAVFHNQEEEQEICDFITKTKVSNAVVSTTKPISEAVNKAIQSIENVVDVSTDIKLPITMSYKTPETLGDDRIAAVIGARTLEQENELLVITAGTCITFNLLSANNEFVGGGISPGIYMRYLAMNTFTGALPLAPNDEFNDLVGKSTIESLQSGVRNGIVAEVDGIISQYKLLYPKIKVFITGGDANFFESRTKNRIFANSNLEVIGMNEILKYNITAE